MILEEFDECKTSTFEPNEYRNYLMKCLEDLKVLWEKKQIDH